MRIPLTLRQYEGADRLIVSAWISTAMSRLSRPATLVVDTGSFITTIGYSDALAMQTSLNNLKSCTTPRRVDLGAAPLWACPVKASYRFKSTEGKKIELNHISYVLIPFTNSDKHIQLAEHVPSIIGLDFVRHHKLKSTIDPANNEYRLETPDDIPH